MNNTGTLFPYLIFAMSFFVSFIIAKYGIPIITFITAKKKLFESPEDPRKVHTVNTPTLGGIAIFASLIMSYAVAAIWMDAWSLYPLFIGALCVMFFVGLKDDLLNIGAKMKLLMQTAAPALLVFGGGLYVESFGGLLGLHNLPLWVGVPFTLFIFVVIINAYNLIDGLDGLAGGIGVIISLFLGVWFVSVDLVPQAVLSFALAGALIGFLFYNWQPASIFMGDTGSMVTGISLAFLIVNMIQTGTHISTAPFHNIIPIFAMALLTVPLYDTLRVFIIRIVQGKSPFASGTEHIHHLFLKVCGTHARASSYLFVANIVVILFVILFAHLPVNILFFLTLGLCLILFPTAGIKRRLLLKLGILSINNDIEHNETNGEWKIKRVNGFLPLKLQLPHWQIPAHLNGQFIGDIIGNGEASVDEKVEDIDRVSNG